MRNITILATILPQVMFPLLAFGAPAGSSGRPSYQLPWELVAKKVYEGAPFCENEYSPDGDILERTSNTSANLDPNRHYAFQPGQAVAIKLPVGDPSGSTLGKVEISLAKWVESSWHDVGKVNSKIESNEIRIDDGFGEEGLFRLLFLGTQERRGWALERYAIVAENWKSDILRFCLRGRQEMELNYSLDLSHSIAISHFHHVLDRIADASFLSGTVLETLKDTVRAKEVFEQGECPELIVGGWNRIRLRRFEGAERADFGVLIPPNCSSTRKWPVLIYVGQKIDPDHSLRPTHHVVVHWRFPGFSNEFEWKDLEYLMSFLSNRLNLDKERISIWGHCGDGIGAMAVALHHPHYFARCSTNTGNSYRHLAGNALNLPVYFEYNESARLLPYCDFAAECFQYYGCRHLQLNRTGPAIEPRPVLPTERGREKNPERVLYTTDSLDDYRAYWVEINGRTDENFAATIDASVKGQTVRVKTKNVDAYSLDLLQAPLSSNGPIEIIENGRSLGAVRGEVFVKRPEDYAKAKYVKNARLHGPIWDAFRDPYVVVYGTSGKDKKFSETSAELAKSLANGAPYFADTAMPEKFVETHNLVLVGSQESNLWLSKICDQLPVHRKQGQIIASGKCYDGRDTAYIVIYPNPLNPRKYVVVFSGTSAATIANISKAYSEIKGGGPSDSLQAVDVAVFEVTERDQIKWLIMERFSTLWCWHKHWDQVLAVANKEHPKWQWRQWFTATLRKQLGADVVVCMDLFKYSDSIPAGEITYRDLFNSFRNDWIIKVKVDGKFLKELLLVPFGNASAQEAMPIIDGVTTTPFKHAGGGEVLGIEELKEGSVFVVAMPYRFVNGEQLGVGLTEYEIVGEGYSVLLLKDYLRNAEDLDLDAQLDSLELNIF